MPVLRAAQFRPFDIRMTGLKGTLDHPGHHTPLRLSASGPAVTYSPLFPQSGDRAAVLYSVGHKVMVIDDEDVRACEIGVEYAVLCETPSDADRDEVKAFASLGLLLFVHNQLRVDLHWLTGWMGIPPLLLEMPHELLERQLDPGIVPERDQKGRKRR